MVFQWFPMVANHWSDDGMVMIHRSGLDHLLERLERDEILFHDDGDDDDYDGYGDDYGNGDGDGGDDDGAKSSDHTLER